MPSSIVRDSATPDDDSQSEQKREFDRWRVAVDLIKRFREAGISCELVDNIQGHH